MAAQALIQLRVVPHVEARKRREDRWERDLLALGELLTAEMPDRASAARSAQWVLQGVSSDPDKRGVEAESRKEVERELSEEAGRCVKSYQALARTRIEWLVNRIVGIAPQHAEIEKLIWLHTRFHMASIVCTLYSRPDSKFDEERFERYWSDERKLREQLTESVEALLRNRPPRNPSRLWRVRRRLADRRKTTRGAKNLGASPADPSTSISR